MPSLCCSVSFLQLKKGQSYIFVWIASSIQQRSNYSYLVIVVKLYMGYAFACHSDECNTPHGTYGHPCHRAWCSQQLLKVHTLHSACGYIFGQRRDYRNIFTAMSPIIINTKDIDLIYIARCHTQLTWSTVHMVSVLSYLIGVLGSAENLV